MAHAEQLAGPHQRVTRPSLEARRRPQASTPKLFQDRTRSRQFPAVAVKRENEIKREEDTNAWRVKKEEDGTLKNEGPSLRDDAFSSGIAKLELKAEDSNEEYTDYRLLSTSYFKMAAAHAIPSSGTAAKQTENRGETLQPQRKVGSTENRFNIIRLHTPNDRKIRMEEWVQPLRLTRKDPTTLGAKEESVPDAVEASAGMQSAAKTASGSTAARKKSLFQKKLRQVFFATDENRMLRREEAFPWILEDFEANQGQTETSSHVKMEGSQGDGGQTWIGRLDSTLSRNHVVLSFSSDGAGFNVIPLSRWYKFTRSSRGRYDTLSFEEAEDLWARHQKNSNVNRWMMAKREEGQSGKMSSASSMPQSRGIKLIERAEETNSAPKFKGVDRSSEFFGEDDDDQDADGGGRRERDEPDEMDFEEEFADDEEGALLEGEDDELKEMEEKIKREMREANRGHVGDHEAEVESAEEDGDDPRLSRGGRKLKLMLRKREKRMGYASDDEEANPYVSDEESSGRSEAESAKSEVSMASKKSVGPSQVSSGALSPQDGTRSKSTGSFTTAQKAETSSAAQSKGATPMTTPRSTSLAGSRAASPIPGGGSAIVARRATSPQRDISASKRKREKDRLAGTGAKLASRETSPVATDKPKDPRENAKRVKVSASGLNDDDVIREEEVIAAIEARKYATREILAMFKAKLRRNPANKDIISETMKKFASLVNHIVVPKART